MKQFYPIGLAAINLICTQWGKVYKVFTFGVLRRHTNTALPRMLTLYHNSNGSFHDPASFQRLFLLCTGHFWVKTCRREIRKPRLWSYSLRGKKSLFWPNFKDWKIWLKFYNSQISSNTQHELKKSVFAWFSKF